MEISKTPLNEKERQQTDESLMDERGKTDESFETYRAMTESETDKAVRANRLEADRARRQRRSAADVGRDGTGLRSINTEARAADQILLTNERESEDTAIRKERKKNDLAIELERGENERLMNKLVSLERETTDKNLMSERAKNDLDAEIAAKRLRIERTAHMMTKSALTTREEFVAIVSHDLRNPLGSILSSAQMMGDDSSNLVLGDDAKRMIEIIKRNAEISLRLISDILDMERIVDGKIQLQIEPCSIGKLVRDTVESFSSAAALKNIELKPLDIEFENSVECDRDRVAQILSNLLGNALKFTPDGGSIGVGTEVFDDGVRISVKDSGSGIPTNEQDRIFERFAQIGNKSRSGLGLGLYISKTLVESHGGKLWVDCAEEGGSKFSFTLPQTCHSVSSSN